MTRQRLFTAALLAIAGLASSSVVHAGPFTFQGIGDLSGGVFASTAAAISGDGKVVVGTGNSASGTEAFRWTAGGGMQGLGIFSGGNYPSEALGTNFNGSVVVGYSGISTVPRVHAFRWTAGGGMTNLGDLLGGIDGSVGTGVSADGSIVVGISSSTFSGASDYEAIRWTSGGGMIGLSDLSGGSNSSQAQGISSDGSVIVGFGTSGSGQEAFRYTTGGGMIGLSDLAGGSFSSVANAASSDGSVIVGRGNSASGNEAFRWTSSGMVGLGDLPGGSFSSTAYGVSADGNVIVGRGASASGNEAMFWRYIGGMVSVRDILIANGVTGLTGWTLTEATGISADGSTIAGWGTNPLGFQESWIATIPEPSSWVLAAIGMICISMIAWRRRPRGAATACARLSTMAALFGVLITLAAGREAQAVQIITNGNFQTASFAGWTVGSTQVPTSFQAGLNDGQNAQIVNGAGGGPAWYLRDKNANYSGFSTATPINGYSAFNGFDGDPGYFFLRQGFSNTAALATADLDFDYAVQSSYGGLSRVFTANILDPGNTIVANVFSYTQPTGNVVAWTPTHVSTDFATTLNSLGPGNYQLEFRMDIPQSYTGPAQFAIDNISLDFAAVPEPSTIALCICGALGIAMAAWRRGHKKVA